jgi:hypothetical protein
MDRRARLGALASVLLGLVWACGSSSSNGAGGDGGAGDGGSSSGASSSGGSSGSASGSGSGGGSGSGSGSGGGSGGSTSSSGGGSGSGSSSGSLPSGRSYPDTNAVIALLVDQLPSMNMAQMQFATSHYVGTEKQLLSVTQQLRALNKDFLVLHYHLCLWQSGPMTPFICNGTSWCNDYPTVTTNESWFWHNTSNQRVIDPDMALLMNITVPAFQQYWEQSLETQVGDGQYDGIMFDSASPSLLQGWVGGSGANQDPRLAGTAAKDTSFPELGNTTWIDAWQTWISKLSADLAAKGIPLIPNDGNFITSWDNTDYTVTSGVFSEGFASTNEAPSDWMASTNELLKLASLDRIMILQNYLSTPSDVATRMYYLGNYLLVKGHHTYLDYFASGPLEWYPEWSVDLGAPTTAATTDVSTLLTGNGGVYRRDFANGSVLVNPSSSPVTVTITGNQVVPMGGGAVDSTGATPGSLSMNAVTTVTVGATTAEIVLH